MGTVGGATLGLAQRSPLTKLARAAALDLPRSAAASHRASQNAPPRGCGTAKAPAARSPGRAVEPAGPGCPSRRGACSKVHLAELGVEVKAQRPPGRRPAPRGRAWPCRARAHAGRGGASQELAAREAGELGGRSRASVPVQDRSRPLRTTACSRQKRAGNTGVARSPRAASSLEPASVARSGLLKVVKELAGLGPTAATKTRASKTFHAAASFSGMHRSQQQERRRQRQRPQEECS